MVIREWGPAWDRGRSLREQAAWDAHAEYMDRGAEEGFFALAGPLGDGPRVLLVVDASDEAAVHARLDEDPWTPMDMLCTVSVEPWHVLVGAERLA